MKTPFKKLILVYALLSFIMSCKNDKKDLTDSERQGLKGNIQFVYEYDSSWSQEKLIEFNSDGSLKKELKIQIILEKPSILYETKYNYNNENNKLISVIEDIYSTVESLRSHAEINYNYNDNKIVSVSYSGKDEKSFKYEDGLKVQVISNSVGKNDDISIVGITQLKYDDNKILVLEIEHLSLMQFGTPIHERKYESKFNNGLKMSTFNFDKKGDNYILSDSVLYFYNEKNDLIKRMNFNLTDNKIVNTTYTYEYDSKNNWTKRTINEGDFVTRKIFYFGDNSNDILVKFETTKNKLKSGYF